MRKTLFGALLFICHGAHANTDLLNQIRNNHFDVATNIISNVETNAFSSTTSEEALTTVNWPPP